MLRSSPLVNDKTNSAVMSPIETGLQPVPTPPTRDLRWWADHEWTGGVELRELIGLESFAIRTLNSTYVFTVLSPLTGEVMMRGGRFFPDPTRAVIAGCSLGGCCLKVHAIYPGFFMEIFHDGRSIVTTGVQAIARLDEGELERVV